ncbi:MAG TPA: biotin synthase BioB [Candidatus Omnitrophota bacterium]|nr:biotin synthase BioB [Candidatus Omnitrophota bacterium]
MNIKNRIDLLKEKVLQGGEVTLDEARELIGAEDEAAVRYLAAAAHEITLFFHSNKPLLCSLINAKSYLCGEDCAFCSQSVHFNTGIERFGLLDADSVVVAAKAAEEKGANSFCVVTSGLGPSEEDFEKLIGIFERLNRETRLRIDCSVGVLTREQAVRMREAGVRQVNHNLQTSREFYSRIVTTHDYETRRRTLRALREGGLEICSGGIFGMGESREDRLKLAFELKEFCPECVPLNFLNARPGTPLEGAAPVDPLEAVRTVSVFRFVHPRANIKLAGGREGNLGQYQELALRGGANGLVIGGYLTTQGNAVRADFEMLTRTGYCVDQ